MAYKPYKMKGHTLPGINQRSEGDTDLPDGRSGSSPFQHSAYGQPHPTNPQGVEQPVGGGHPGTAEAHNVKPKAKKKAKGKSSPLKCPLIAALAPMIGGMMSKKKE